MWLESGIPEAIKMSATLFRIGSSCTHTAFSASEPTALIASVAQISTRSAFDPTASASRTTSLVQSTTRQTCTKVAAVAVKKRSWDKSRVRESSDDTYSDICERFPASVPDGPDHSLCRPTTSPTNRSTNRFTTLAPAPPSAARPA
jgi:hypothetical protein